MCSPVCSDWGDSDLVERLNRSPEIRLVVSEEILAEIKNTPGYPRVRKHLSLSDEEIEIRVASLGVLGDVVPGELKVQAVKD